MTSEIKNVNREESYSMWDYCKGAAYLVGAGLLAGTVAYVAKTTFSSQTTQITYDPFPNQGWLQTRQLSAIQFEDLVKPEEPTLWEKVNSLFRKETTNDKEERRTYSIYYPYISVNGQPFPTTMPIVAAGSVTQMFTTENCLLGADLFTVICDAKTPFTNLSYAITGSNNSLLPAGMAYTESHYIGSYRYPGLNLTKLVQSLGNINFEFRVTNAGGNATIFPFTAQVLSYADSLPHTGSNFPNLVNYVKSGKPYQLFVGVDSTYVYSPLNDGLTITAQVRSADLSPSLSYDNVRDGYVLQGTMGSDPIYLDVLAEGSRLSTTFTISVLQDTGNNPNDPNNPQDPSKSSGSSTPIIAGAVAGGGAFLIGGSVVAYLVKNGFFKKKNSGQELTQV